MLRICMLYDIFFRRHSTLARNTEGLGNTCYDIEYMYSISVWELILAVESAFLAHQTGGKSQNTKASLILGMYHRPFWALVGDENRDT